VKGSLTSTLRTAVIRPTYGAEVHWPDAAFPADPYPGAVPPASFAHVDEVSYALDPDPRGLVRR
jgi:hypothetical protein